MLPASVLRSLAVQVIFAALLAPVASARRVAAAAPTHAPGGTSAPLARPAAGATTVSAVVARGDCEPLPGPAPDHGPLLRTAVGLNYPSEDLDAAPDGTLEVCVLVDSTGTVREARLTRSSAPYDSAAVDAVRWWVFAPARRAGRATAARIEVTVYARPPRDADPMVPDVVALAQDAEARGNLREALDAWTGALARAGTHPMLQNEWAIREHIVHLAARLPKPPEVPPASESRARGMHNLMLRNLSRAMNEDCATALDDVLRAAPWYADAYRWRASARAASGHRDGAVRDVLCYRMATQDSAGRAVADRALVALAAADTIAALTMLKN